MVKFDELKINQLKVELGDRKLNKSGTKAELQRRLREAMEAEGINVDEYEFQPEQVEDVETMESGAGEIKDLLASILFKMDQRFEQQNDKMDRSFENQSEKLNQKLENLEQSLEEKFEKRNNDLEQSLEQKLHKQRIDLEQSLEEKLNDQTQQIAGLDQKIAEQITGVNQKTEELECRMLSLQQRMRELETRPVAVRSVTECATSKLKAPYFDGTTSFSVFKLQFETTAAANGWSSEEMAAAVIVALKGTAAEALQMIPQHNLNDYQAIMTALHRRYGSEHKKQIYQMEVANRKQQAHESLKEFAAEVERLAYLAFADDLPEFREKQMVQSFVAGIRDSEIKRAAYSFPKNTFAETVAFALTQETACLLSKPFCKLRQMQMDEEDSVAAICKRIERMEGILDRESTKPNIKCYNCGKMGHIARNCWRKKSNANEGNGSQSEQQQQLN